MYARKVPSLFGWFFGRKLTPKELLRKNQRAITNTIRAIEREQHRLNQEEKRAVANIRHVAKNGQIDTVRVLAKELARTRGYVKKMILMKANLEAVGIKIRTIQTQHGISEAILATTGALRAMNAQFKIPRIARILQEFERQSGVMDLKEEAINDSVEEHVTDPDDSDLSDSIVAQVLDELGLELSDQLGNLPGGSKTVGTKKGTTVVETIGHVKSAALGTTTAKGPSPDDEELEKRLANLRRL